MKLFSGDISDTIKHLIKKEVGKDQFAMYETSVSRSFKFDVPTNVADVRKQQFQVLAEVVRFTNLDKGISIYTAIAMFLIWIGQTYMKSGKLKITFLDWPKLVGKVIGLIFEIVQIVKKEIAADALLLAESQV